MTAVQTWFGKQFVNLHPLLQRLHLQGGQLVGQVVVSFGRGLSGWLGRRVAARLGIPPQPGVVPLRIQIQSTNEGLLWTRTFAAGPPVTSVFTPVGVWPDGHWIEQAGSIRLELKVNVVDGAWCWNLGRTMLAGLPLPAWTSPQLHASKRVENGKYDFEVAVSHPLLGLLLSYSGRLSLTESPAVV